MMYLLIFGGLGLWMLVESDFSIEQESQLFQVRRRLWSVRWSWSYPLGQVKWVEVFKAKDGDGLRLVLISGRKIRLTMSASWERQSMYQGQAALEYAIRKYEV
ncbi:MAG: hypothetical protein K2X03_16170 [Bryobacteraceae bacterium]|nr:hypothetical protein [Bryobacteraceae bacterium]